MPESIWSGPFFHGECVNLTISQKQLQHFFSIWVFFHENSRFTWQQGKGEAICLTLFRMDILGAAHGWWGQKGAPLLNLSDISYNKKPVISYLKKIQKVHESRDTFFAFFRHQHFFLWKWAQFTISRKTDIDCVLVHHLFF